MKNKITLVQRIIAKKISDLDRLRRLVAFVSQYNRIKFGDAVPQYVEHLLFLKMFLIFLIALQTICGRSKCYRKPYSI